MNKATVFFSLVVMIFGSSFVAAQSDSVDGNGGQSTPAPTPTPEATLKGKTLSPGTNQRRFLLLPDGIPPTKTTCTFDAIDGSGATNAVWDPYSSDGMGRIINLPPKEGGYYVSCSSEPARLVSTTNINVAWKYSGFFITPENDASDGPLSELKEIFGIENENKEKGPKFFILLAEPNENGQYPPCNTIRGFRIETAISGGVCHAIAGQPVTLPTIEATLKGLSSATAGPKMRPSQRALSPQGFGEQAAEDFFQAVAEVMVERAKSKGTRLLQNEIREVFCEELFIDFSEEKPKIGPKKDNNDRAIPIFPTTCEAVRSSSVNDLAGFGRQLQSTIVDDLMLTGARLMMLRLRDNESFASIPAQFDQVVVELLQSLTAQARNGGLDADKLSQTVFVKLSGMLQDPDLYTPVLKNMAARSRTIQSLQQSLTESNNWSNLPSECDGVKDAIKNLDSRGLTQQINKQFDDIQKNFGEYKKAKLKNPSPQESKSNEDITKIIRNLAGAFNPKAILEEIKKLDSSAQKAATGFDKCLNAAVGNPKMDESDKQNLEAAKRIVVKIKTVLESARRVVATAQKIKDWADKNKNLINHPASCEMQLAVASVADCGKRGECDASSIVDYIEHPNNYFDIGGGATCGDYFHADNADHRRGVTTSARFVSVGVDLMNPPKNSTQTDQLHRIVELVFSTFEFYKQAAANPNMDGWIANELSAPNWLAEGISTDLPTAKNTSENVNGNLPIRIAKSLRQIADGAIDKDTQRVVTAAGALLFDVAENRGKTTDKKSREASRSVQKALALASAMTSYMSTYTGAGEANPDVLAARKEARKAALNSLIDATTNRSDRVGDIIISLGGSVRTGPYGDVRYADGWRHLYQPIGLTLGVGVDGSWYGGSETRAWGFHFEASAVDLAHYVTIEEKSDQTGEKETRKANVEDALAPSLTIGPELYFPESDIVVFVGPTFGYSGRLREYRLKDGHSEPPIKDDYVAITSGSYYWGVVAGVYIPIFDIN